MSTILTDPTERIRLVDHDLGSGRSDADDPDARVTKLLENATGIQLSGAHEIGKRTTIEGAILHVQASAILKAEGKRGDTCTEDEYLEALERAEKELGDYDRSADVIDA